MADLLIPVLFKLVLRDTWRPGFNNKVVQKSTKSFSSIYMDASFYIWLARNSTGWSSNISLITTEDANFPASGRKNTNPTRDNPSSNTASLSSQPTRNEEYFTGNSNQ